MCLLTPTVEWRLVFVGSILKDLYCLPWLSLNSLAFTIKWQLLDRKPEPTCLPTQRIFKLPYHVMRATGLWWSCKFYTTVEIQTGRGVGIGNWTTYLQIRSLSSKKVRHSNHFAIENATSLCIFVSVCVYISDYLNGGKMLIIYNTTLVLGLLLVLSPTFSISWHLKLPGKVISLHSTCTLPGVYAADYFS